VEQFIGGDAETRAQILKRALEKKIEEVKKLKYENE